LTLDTSNYCFVAFRGAFPTFQDWVGQNFDDATRVVTTRSAPDGSQKSEQNSCNVRNGSYEAYVGDGFDVAIQNFINNCTKSTSPGGGKKQLVFTGHSQGGTAAGVAAIINAVFDPLTITFAQPPFLKSDNCTSLNPNRLWRVINTENSADHGIQYDPVSRFILFLFSVICTTTGSSFNLIHLFLIPPLL
jgi:Lipase (class 3)